MYSSIYGYEEHINKGTGWKWLDGTDPKETILNNKSCTIPIVLFTFGIRKKVAPSL